MLSGPVHIVAGVITNERGEVLLAQRLPGMHQGGLWEFPGGKKESGEAVYYALARELKEELNIEISRARPLIKIDHHYPDKHVQLDVWQIEQWSGEPYGREGQPLQWCAIHDLTRFDFPAANHGVVRALQLPSLYLISPGPQGSIKDFLDKITLCLEAGARIIQLRCLSDVYLHQADIIRKVIDTCNAYEARVLLNAAPATALMFKAHGVHLNSARLLQLNDRPLGADLLVAASCHNQNELAHAERIGADFAVLSPVLSTPSHPEAVPMGWKKFAGLLETTNMPVYALGGMQPGHLRVAWHHGSQGIAMLSGIWSAPDPAGIINACLNA